MRMRKRKNLQVLGGKDHTVMIAAGGKHLIFDAAGCLFEWLAVRRATGISDGKPLFCHASGKSISMEEVRCMMRRVMEAAGRDPKVYGSHSLRIGGTTAAHAANIPPSPYDPCLDLVARASGAGCCVVRVCLFRRRFLIFIPPSLIRLMGRWSSDIYEIYCRLLLESVLGVGQAIASAQVTAAAEAFQHDENLEMLPSEVARLAEVFGEEAEAEEAEEGRD